MAEIKIKETTYKNCNHNDKKNNNAQAINLLIIHEKCYACYDETERDMCEYEIL